MCWCIWRLPLQCAHIESDQMNFNTSDSNCGSKKNPLEISFDPAAGKWTAQLFLFRSGFVFRFLCLLFWHFCHPYFSFGSRLRIKHSGNRKWKGSIAFNHCKEIIAWVTRSTQVFWPSLSSFYLILLINYYYVYDRWKGLRLSKISLFGCIYASTSKCDQSTLEQCNRTEFADAWKYFEIIWIRTRKM